jgi:hypothetical protein
MAGIAILSAAAANAENLLQRSINSPHPGSPGSRARIASAWMSLSIIPPSAA